VLSTRHGFEKPTRRAAPALLEEPQGSRLGPAAPVIILGGMKNGYFTPTEAAVVAVFYVLLRLDGGLPQLSWRDGYDVLVESAESPL